MGERNSIVSIVHHGDNIAWLKQFPDKFFDLAYPDPPYGLNATEMSMGSAPNRNEAGQYPGESTAVKLKKRNRLNRLNGGGGKLKDRALNTMPCQWDETPPPPEYFKELFRVSKNQIIWGGNYFDLPPCRCFVVWDKKQPWENFSQAEFAWTSFDMPAKVFSFSNKGGANSEVKIHPTQKPVPLYDYLLEKFAKPGMKILDTHMGSQASRIAAYKAGYDYWGAELDADYFRTGCERFESFRTETEEIKQYGYARTELEKENPLLFAE